jgi:hypothetical protein
LICQPTRPGASGSASIRRSRVSLNGHQAPSPGWIRHLTGIPCWPAFLYHVRLEAVRRQAAVDGQLIDPWHLAAVLEGLRLRMDDATRIIDRGVIFDAARHALILHQWLTAADFDQEGEVKQAEAALATPQARHSPLLSAAPGMGRKAQPGVVQNLPIPGNTRALKSPCREGRISFWLADRLVRETASLARAAQVRWG